MLLGISGKDHPILALFLHCLVGHLLLAAVGDYMGVSARRLALVHPVQSSALKNGDNSPWKPFILVFPVLWAGGCEKMVCSWRIS